MRLTLICMLAALASVIQPVLAQTPGAGSPPAGTQNPALVQPPPVVAPQKRLMLPPESQPVAPDTSPSSLITPGGPGGLCECLNSYLLNANEFDKSRLHQSCLGSVEACRTACNTRNLYSYIPNAAYTCPVQPGQAVGPVALNAQRPLRLLSSR